MVILVSPDPQGRIPLSGLAKSRQYSVEVAKDGVITLRPFVIPSQRIPGASAPIVPVLSPEEAFGITGIIEAADAVYANKEHRRRHNPVERVFTESELHSLVWGGAA